MKYFNYIALCFICIFLFSCSAEYHMAQAKKKKPSLFQVDTLKIKDTGSVVMKEPTVEQINQLDSLLEALMDCGNDSTIKQASNNNSNIINELKNKSASQSNKRQIKNKVLDLYKNKPCINPGDTLEYAAEGIVVKVWQEGNRLRFSHYKLITTEAPKIVNADLPKWVWFVIIVLGAVCFALFVVVLIRR